VKSPFNATDPRNSATVTARDNTPFATEESADVYRGRAEQARLAAKEAVDLRDRRIYETLAASYEELARNAEMARGVGLEAT